MPCHFPHGDENDWCERHKADRALIRALREGSPRASA